MNRTLKLFLALVSLCMTAFCFAQKSELQFNKDGKFKIVQFTDVHFKYKNPASDIALERINQVLDEEQPDFVIFTGDIVYSAPADKGMLQVLEQVSKRKLPFVVTFGNHDNEQGMTREQLYDIICQVPGNLMPDRGSGLCIDRESLFRCEEGCSRPVLHGLSFLLPAEGCERLRMAHVRSGQLVSSAERSLYSTERREAIAGTCFLPHSCAGIQ